MTEKTCQQRYVALVNMVFDQEGDLANHFLELFPTPAVFRNMTMEEQDAFWGYDRKRLKPVLAAIELGNLILTCPHDILGHAYSSNEVGQFLMDEMAGQMQESVEVLCTDVHNEIIARRCLFKGGQAECMLYPDQIFRYVLHWNSFGLIMVHNHPSGDPEPSRQDLSFMRRLERGCQLLGLHLLDCLVIGSQDYYSWRESQEAHAAFNDQIAN